MAKTKSPHRIEAEALADRLVQDYSSEVLQELVTVLKERLPKGSGRPTGSGKDDSARLERVVELLERGEADAIVIAAEEDPGNSAKNTRKRLRRKLPDFVAQRKRDKERVRRQEVLQAAFEEEVEVWDL